MVMFMSLFENWPFEQLEQPLKGVVLIVLTLILAGVFSILAWNVFKLPDYWIYYWTFTVWAWQVTVQWLTARWPSGSGN